MVGDLDPTVRPAGGDQDINDGDDPSIGRIRDDGLDRGGGMYECRENWLTPPSTKTKLEERPSMMYASMIDLDFCQSGGVLHDDVIGEVEHYGGICCRRWWGILDTGKGRRF